jgi:DNA-binding XRE family transcriptional regulator
MRRKWYAKPGRSGTGPVSEGIEAHSGWTCCRGGLLRRERRALGQPLSEERALQRGLPTFIRGVLGLDADIDREVIRCKTCGLVQYRTHAGNCRRCLRLLTPKTEFRIPPPELRELLGDDRQLFQKWPNHAMVENIGQRIRQVRESRGMTQSQLQARSRVSGSTLSRIENGHMVPSLVMLKEDFRSPWRRLEPLLRPENERRSSPGGSIHSGFAAVSTAARMGTVAINSDALGGHQQFGNANRPLNLFEKT